MSERSTGSQYDAGKVDGRGEQRRQQNEQSNPAGGQQGTSGGSMGAGPVSNPPRDDSGRDSKHGPRDYAQSLHQRSMGEGPVGASRDGRVGAMSRDNQQMQGQNPGPRDEGLADEVNQGLAQADPAKSVGPQRGDDTREGKASDRAGSSSGPGDANGSGSMGSTRRDDAPRAPRR